MQKNIPFGTASGLTQDRPWPLGGCTCMAVDELCSRRQCGANDTLGNPCAAGATTVSSPLRNGPAAAAAARAKGRGSIEGARLALVQLRAVCASADRELNMTGALVREVMCDGGRFPVFFLKKW